MDKVAFLGLGVMGFPMAGHIAKRDYDVAVYNRTAAKAEKWAGVFNGRSVATVGEAVKDADIVFTCLGDDPDVAAVIDEALPHLNTGVILVDHTTASPALARDLHEILGERGVGFIDAPVSGGQAGAENGKLSIMCGGNAVHVELARPVMEAYGAALFILAPLDTASSPNRSTKSACGVAGAFRGGSFRNTVRA